MSFLFEDTLSSVRIRNLGMSKINYSIYTVIYLESRLQTGLMFNNMEI